MTEKTFIDARQLLDDSFQLALDIFESDYRPDYIVGIWRGGTPIGIAVQELLAYLGVKTDHIAIRTSYYVDIEKRGERISVFGLNYLINRVTAKDSILIVDDVYDTGLSIQQVIHELKDACQQNTPDLKIATTWFKPGNNQTDRTPDFYVHSTDKWLVFPHELQGLSVDELIRNKPCSAAIKESLLRFKSSH